MYTPDSLVKLAVHDIVLNINSGCTPQDATIKVAKELCLNPNFIKRSAEAVNVALHHNHFKKNPDAKADDFPIVDAQGVVENIYGGKEKTASELQSELFSSFQYPETQPKFARYLEEGKYKDQFAKIAALDEPIKFNTSEKGLCEKSYNYISKLKKLAFEKEAEAMEADFNVDKTFCNILKKFAADNATRSSWDTFETAVFSKYGESSTGYLDLLYKSSDLTEPRGKHDSTIKLAVDCNELGLYDKFIDSINNLKPIKKAAEEAAQNLKFEQDYIKDAFQKLGCELNKTSEVEDKSTILDKVEKSLLMERQKIASVDEEEDPVLFKISQDKSKELEKTGEHIKAAIGMMDMVGSFYKGEGKPSLSANTNTPENNRERALLLQELATTDPVISKFPAKQTINAYEQMLRIAPELSSEKEITRAFLRQAGASQAIDPFQAEQLIKANTGLFKQHQLEQGIQPTSDKQQ